MILQEKFLCNVPSFFGSGALDCDDFKIMPTFVFMHKLANRIHPGNQPLKHVREVHLHEAGHDVTGPTRSWPVCPTTDYRRISRQVEALALKDSLKLGGDILQAYLSQTEEDLLAGNPCSHSLIKCWRRIVHRRELLRHEVQKAKLKYLLPLSGLSCPRSSLLEEG